MTRLVCRNKEYENAAWHIIVGILYGGCVRSHAVGVKQVK
jgi:hypothetical protein